MPTYDFTFPSTAAGFPVSVTEDGVEVATATVGAAVARYTPIVVQVDLPEGVYVGQATDPVYFSRDRAPGALNVLASVAEDADDITAEIGQALSATFAPVGGVVNLTGAQTVAGVKTFSSAPAVPDASFTVAKTTGLQTALDGKAPTRNGIVAFRGMAPVNDIGQFGNEYLSNGTDTQQMTRASYILTRSVRQMSLFFGNWRWDAGTIVESAPTATLTVRASIEVGGVTYPVFFNGSRSVLLEPEGQVQTDPISIEAAAGAIVFVRTYITTTTGTWSTNRVLNTAVRTGEGTESGTSITDKTLTGTVTTTAARGFTPMYILGEARTGPVIAAIGDSILYGANDVTGTGAVADRGYIARAFAGSGYSLLKMGAGGDKPSLYKTWANSRRRRNLTEGATHAVVALGINDIRLGVSAATVIADLTAVWTLLAAQGIKVYACTITPKSTSSDNWVTLANQTVDTYHAARLTVNAWIRTTPAPLSGYIEIADVVESARDSGKWIVSGASQYATSDGLHPSSAVHILMAAAVNVAIFT